jgi:hypothetical protein
MSSALLAECNGANLIPIACCGESSLSGSAPKVILLLSKKKPFLDKSDNKCVNSDSE